ncbi:MAG: ferritin-like domain-containing protein [Bacteroidota bacterium]|nr:ferritin-like domain-containing protein [Bacteroidota bacterium]
MSDILQPRGSDDNTLVQPIFTPIKRRSFFMYAGATAGATALVLAGCSKDSPNPGPNLPTGNSTTSSGAISLGSGDVGVLNYAYALEQLEAHFYSQVVALSATVLSTTEYAYFQQVAKHEAIHRDFFKAALTRDAGTQVLRGLTPKYPAGTFTDKPTLLNTAKAFEDLGVAAYNGAGKLLKSADYLLLAGKIVSVEARHAAYVRDLISNGSFAADDQVDAISGLDKSMTPVAVLTTAQTFITEMLDGSAVGVNA